MIRPPGAGRRWLALVAMLVAAAPSPTPAQQPGAQPARHAVTGLVVAVDVAERRLVVSHDEIPGLMRAMTMPFEVRDPMELAGLVPGTAVAFTLVVERETAYAERVAIRKYETGEQDPLTARRLAIFSEVTAPHRTAALAPGAAVPDFALIDETGRPVTLAQFRGKVVALNFVYTGCALPQFCFRIANHFGVLQKRFTARMGRDLVLLTVTFDPARDRPEVLAAYAAQWTRDADAWRFLTGEIADVRRVCALFGVDAFQDEALMNHSTRTVIIDRRGVLAASIEGNRYTAAQLGDVVEAALAR